MWDLYFKLQPLVSFRTFALINGGLKPNEKKLVEKDYKHKCIYNHGIDRFNKDFSKAGKEIRTRVSNNIFNIKTVHKQTI